MIQKKYFLSLAIFSSAILFFEISLFLSLKIAWIVFLCIFYGGVFYILKYRGLEIFQGWRRNFFLTWIFLYPALHIVVTYMVENDVIAYSYRYLNTIEHILLMGSIAFILYGIFYNIFKKVNFLQGSLVLFCFLLSIGISIEVLQYGMRMFFYEPVELYKIAAYYHDTIADVTTNIFAGIFWSLIIVRKKI